MVAELGRELGIILASKGGLLPPYTDRTLLPNLPQAGCWTWSSPEISDLFPKLSLSFLIGSIGVYITLAQPAVRGK